MAKNPNCPVFESAHLFGKKWVIVLLQEISLGEGEGFNHLYKRMGKISPKIISNLLKELEAKGFVERSIVEGAHPVRTSYVLTKKGKEFHQIALDFRKWQSTHSPKIAGCEKEECVKCPNYC